MEVYVVYNTESEEVVRVSSNKNKMEEYAKTYNRDDIFPFIVLPFELEDYIDIPLLIILGVLCLSVGALLSVVISFVM